MTREELIDITVANIKDDCTVCDFRAFVDIILGSLPDDVIWAYLDRRQAENQALTNEGI